MKYHQYIIPTLILALYSGMTIGCVSRPEKKLKIKGFVLSYKNKTSAKNKLTLGSFVKKIQLDHPIKILESDVRSHLESLMFEELSLFGKKKHVFIPQDVARISRLLTKALHHVPSHKIIHYELEASGGTTEGDIFASKKYIHWRFTSINGMGFSGRAYTGWGNANWRLVPQTGQSYHTVKRVLGTLTHENWIRTKLVPSNVKSRQKNPRSLNAIKALSKNPEDTAPTKILNTPLEKKLKFLKDLYKKNLVNKKEYKQKRKELLDSYL
jgi:hypothetical protein